MLSPIMSADAERHFRVTSEGSTAADWSLLLINPIDSSGANAPFDEFRSGGLPPSLFRSGAALIVHQVTYWS